jgi:hypothetical protein
MTGGQSGLKSLRVMTDRRRRSDQGTPVILNTDLEADNIEGRHPYEFYRKVGFTIVGALPDANGFGQPDIFMAKRVRNGA